MAQGRAHAHHYMHRAQACLSAHRQNNRHQGKVQTTPLHLKEVDCITAATAFALKSLFDMATKGSALGQICSCFEVHFTKLTVGSEKYPCKQASSITFQML